jgi:flagellar biosynthesis/type III secretory pathway chaperone
MTEHPASWPSAAPSGQPAPASARMALKSAVVRLIQVLDRETTALRRREPVDMDDLCDRKNQALLELSRIAQRFDSDTMDAELRPMLAQLREKLDENRSVLTLHLQAVQEVAEILAAAIRDADSDGTYAIGPAAIGSAGAT